MSISVPVLLSNAPLLHSGVNGCYNESNISYDQSRGSSFEVPRTYPHPTSKSCSFDFPAQGHTSIIRQYYKVSPRHDCMFGHSMPGDELAVRKGRELFDRFKASDAYIKYRSRQEKEDNGSADQKWPEELDLAFCEALVHWPPMGRRKQTHKNKARGRNELIADYLYDRTGHVRTRKQVSSHIQVLKPFVEHDEVIMEYFSTKDPTGHQTYSNTSAYCFAPRIQSNFHGLVTDGYCTQIGYPQNRLAKNDLGLFQPAEFQMFVYRNLETRELPTKYMHIYTTGSPPQSQLPDLTCPSWATLARDYPQLHDLRQEGPLDCNVILAEASIALPTQSWGDSNGVELAIRLKCESRLLGPGSEVICYNRIAQAGSDFETTESEVIQLASDPGNSSSAAMIKFCSRFWAGYLQSLVGRAQWSGPGFSGDLEHKIANKLRSLTATQEFHIMTTSGEERILVICWSFQLSEAQMGQTYWRRLRLPQQPIEYREEFQNHMSAAGGADAWHDHRQSPFDYESSSASALTPAAWSASEGIKMEHSLSQSGTADFAKHSESSFNSHSNSGLTDHQVSQMESYDPALSFAGPAFNNSVFGLTGDVPMTDSVMPQSSYTNVWMGNSGVATYDATHTPRAHQPYSVQHGNRGA